MFNTYAALFGALCYLGLDQAFVRFFREPPGKASRTSLLSFCLSTSLAFSLVSTLLLLFGWRFISAQVMTEPDFGVFACLFAFSFCTVIFRYLALIYRMEQNAKLYTLQGVIQILLTKIAYLAVGFSSSEAKPAIILLTVLMASVTLTFAFIQRKQFSFRFAGEIDKPFVKEVAAFRRTADPGHANFVDELVAKLGDPAQYAGSRKRRYFHGRSFHGGDRQRDPGRVQYLLVAIRIRALPKG